MKIGRNEPCPCGSEKKYKRCCLNKATSSVGSNQIEEPKQFPAGPSSLKTGPSDQSDYFISPYVTAKTFQNSDVFSEMKRLEPEKARRFWTPKNVEKLATEEIIDKLRQVGITTSKNDYLEQTSSQISAWYISNQWLRTLEGNGLLSRFDQDFIGLASCELWKRFCPNYPSIEMIDDQMQNGYGLLNNGENMKACDQWWEVWKNILHILGTEVRTLESSDRVFNGSQSIHNWTQEFSLECYNAALNDGKYAQIGVQFCQEWLTQFSDENGLIEQNFRADLGQFHFLNNDIESGEKVLVKLIEDYPNKSIGYANLSDSLASTRGNSKPINLPRAKKLLERALAEPVTDADSYDLEARLEHVQKLITDG